MKLYVHRLGLQLATKMNFNRRPFQFSPDFGFEHASSSFRDHFDESSEVNDMFSAGAPPGRWDAADLPRFHVVRKLPNLYYYYIYVLRIAQCFLDLRCNKAQSDEKYVIPYCYP